MRRPLAYIAAFTLVALSAPMRVDAAGEPLDAIIAIDGMDGEQFTSSLAQRLRAPVKLMPASAPARDGRARLEFSFDAASGMARLAYHDGVSEAPALVVIAEFARGTPPGASWFLSQAEAAIESFGSCVSMISAPIEILDPWSPSDTARAQRWAEVLDPWLGCAELPTRPARLKHDDDFFLLEGEVLDPWSEAAYAERGVALVAPKPGVPSRALTH